MERHLSRDDIIRDNVRYKKFAYDVIRMEEDEEKDTFWYHCAKLVKTITNYYDEDTRKWTISETGIFLHKRYMKNGGEYSKNQRVVSNHIGVDPIYIKYYMETLDLFFKEHKYEENIAILT